MGRLTAKEQASALSGERSLATVRAARELRRRGIVLRRAELARRTLAECIDAINWAVNDRPPELRPAWIGELLAEGKGLERTSRRP